MDHYPGSTWASSPHSPAPLALHDFMSQNAVSSSTPEDSLSPLDTVTAADADIQSSTRPPTGTPSKPTPLSQEIMPWPGDSADAPDGQKPGGKEREREALVQEAPAREAPMQYPEDLEEVGQNVEPDAESDASPDAEPDVEPGAEPALDWKAIRVQLPVGKKAKDKMDWIRGWVDEVRSYGETAFCACSRSFPDTPRVASPAASAPDAAMSPWGSDPGSDGGLARSEGDAPVPCASCKRPMEFPDETTWDSGPESAAKPKSLRKKMSGLVKRVMMSHKSSGLPASSGTGTGTGPSSVAKGSTPSVLLRRRLVQSPQREAKDTRALDPDVISSSEGESHPAARRSRDRQERLARAQHLLDRTATKK